MKKLIETSRNSLDKEKNTKSIIGFDFVTTKHKILSLTNQFGIIDTYLVIYVAIEKLYAVKWYKATICASMRTNRAWIIFIGFVLFDRRLLHSSILSCWWHATNRFTMRHVFCGCFIKLYLIIIFVSFAENDVIFVTCFTFFILRIWIQS